MRSAVGIARHQITGADSLFDMWWYGIIPGTGHMSGSARRRSPCSLQSGSWSASAVAAALMALLLVSIHAEWDLVTFLAPTAGSSERK